MLKLRVKVITYFISISGLIMTNDADRCADRHQGNVLFSARDEFTKEGEPQAEKSHTRRRWVILSVIALITIGAGAGIGIGVGLSHKNGDSTTGKPPPSAPATSNERVANLTMVKNKLLEYIPLDIQRANTIELVESYVAQVSRMEPVAQLLSYILPVLGLNASIIQPQAIQVLVQTWMEDNKIDSSSLTATIDNLAQLTQGVLDYQANLVPIARGLRTATSLVRSSVNRALEYNSSSLRAEDLKLLLADNVGRSRSRSRSLLQDDATEQAKQRFHDLVESVLMGASTSPFMVELRKLYDPSTLPDLLVDMYIVLERLARAEVALRDIMDRLDRHLDLGLQIRLPIINPRNSTNLQMLANIEPYDKRTTPALSDQRRRRLQVSSPLEAALMMRRLPHDFTPVSAAERPRLLVPLVFHIMTYRQGDSFGPPNWNKAPDFTARIVDLVNAMAFPTNFAFFVNEVRYDPVTNPYLLRDSRSAWMDCSSEGNYLYKDCSSVLQGAKDFPRSLNIFVVGDRSSASYAGYGWVPSSPIDIATGHVALLWSIMDTGQWNSRLGWEYGAKVLWHEIIHHMGLYHNFGRSAGGGCSALNDDGVPDTPIVAGPVYNQAAFADASRTYCLNFFRNQLGSNWDRATEEWRSRLGIPDADVLHGFDSCPSQPGNDELGNYIGYTHDVCVAALGHMTAGQVAYMHNSTERIQNKLYQWGQYFASIAPDAFMAPPPLRGPAPEGSRHSVCMRTRGGCKCRQRWTFRGKPLSGCANPDGDTVGLWCPVEQDGNCASAVNGYWDYCPPAASLNLCAAAQPESSPQPPPRPPPSEPCGPGWLTESGSMCSRNRWALVDADDKYDESHIGCANPDNDPEGPWCRLQTGFTTLLGRNWDYCGSQCRTGNGVQADGTAATYCAASQGLPAGCTCRSAWGILLQNDTMASVGRRYISARYCTVLPELESLLESQSEPETGYGATNQQQQQQAAAGVCVVTNCQDADLNGRAMICNSPCTTLTEEDGEDVPL